MRRRADHPDLAGTFSVNQRLPSGPLVIPAGKLLGVGMVNSAMACVVGLIIPIWLVPPRVNHRLPSGPVVIAFGSAPGVGIGNWSMACVVGLISPIWSPFDSVNQRFPSGPVVIAEG